MAKYFHNSHLKFIFIVKSFSIHFMNIISCYFLPNSAALKLCCEKYKYIAVQKYVPFLYLYNFIFVYSFSALAFGNKCNLMISVLMVYSGWYLWFRKKHFIKKVDRCGLNNECTIHEIDEPRYQ